MYPINAWRFLGGKIAYVCEINTSRNRKGDKYSYTNKVENALPMTEKQCRSFQTYMLDCGTKGYYC